MFRSTIWEAPDDMKVTDGTLSTEDKWKHVTITLPPSEVDSQVCHYRLRNK